MFEIFSDMSAGMVLCLVLALLFVLAYEFINGFHDTANAVATVIYTKAMPATWAVIASGFFNFLGVLTGGIAVAYAIVHLLPVDLLLDIGSTQGLVMVFSLLAAAIIWNFGTWYLGLPASSSHTLIGAIMGVGLANAILNGLPMTDGINVKKAIDIMLSLIISPAIGLVFAGLLLWTLKRFRTNSKMHMTPEERRVVDGKKHPPFWARLALVLSSMGMSYSHGSNDGQKGIGLLMLVLIGVAPAHFLVKADSTALEISRTRDAAVYMQQFYERNADKLGEYMAAGKVPNHALPPLFKCEPANTLPAINELVITLDKVHSFSQLQPEVRRKVRRMLVCLDDTANKLTKLPGIDSKEKDDLKKLRKDLTGTIEYVPTWAIVAVALALGLGTMVGWKRIVITVGEKIGNTSMTYAQGMAAQITASVAISVASWTGMPVSTTHLLSSSVAGTMVANRSGLQGNTVKNILLAWVLTLPASMLLSAGLYFLARKMFV